MQRKFTISKSGIKNENYCPKEDNHKLNMILKMKTLNKEHVELIHHKIEGLASCLNSIEPNCFMASIETPLDFLQKF